MSQWAGQRVLVTGASSGIGAGLAERFAREGSVVGLAARRADRLEDVRARRERVDAGSTAWVADLGDAAQVDRLAASALDEWGGVDVLVNNAGIPRRRHVTQLDMDAVEEVLRLNYVSPVRLMLALLPSMLARDSGRIVNVSSVAATLSSPGEAAYDASKSALAVFSEAMAIDLWDTGVHVTVVYPGVVDTELFTIPGNDPLPPGIEPITVDELVDAVFDGLERGVSQVYVPSWFEDIASGKAANIEGFLAGAAEFIRQSQAGS